MYQGLNRMYEIVCEDPHLFLPERAADELWQLANEVCVHYDSLTRLALQRGKLLYSPAFKVHAMLHLCRSALYQHPRATWSYVFEDFVGRVKELATSCMHGTPLHKIASKVVSQWLLGFSARLKHLENSELARAHAFLTIPLAARERGS